ncbi:MAG TPA: TetR/AcrR family transcriptional regulator [Actinomadura sp.]|nr:TetR/AcrR family transcriptional regulator [Actinomadura sp.]
MTTEFSGRGDPKRSLELLWGVQERPRRGPKPRLTVQQITQAAIEIADAEGLAALSMRHVADRLGVAAMSLYTYVPGKAELVDVMLDTVAGEAPLLGELHGDWRARVELWARQSLASHRRHPWVLQVATVHPPMGPNEVAWGDSALRALSGIGLSDREIVAMINVVDGYVRGVARTSVDAAQVEQHTGLTDEQWYASRAPLLDKLIDPARYPTMRSFHDAGVFEDPIDGFEFGLQRLLDGIEQLIRARCGQSTGC